MDHGRGTSFFFSNFPPDFIEVDMWKVFQRWGRVSDIFISRRLNIKRQRFRFVRFMGVQNVRELEKSLSSVWIETWKVIVNRPKYNKTVETSKEWNVKQKAKAKVEEKVGKKV